MCFHGSGGRSADRKGRAGVAVRYYHPKIYDEGAVGTGDAMVGAIANAMHAGMKFDEVARYAVAMGRACARLAGTEMASLKKVYEVYETTQVYVL